MANSEFNRSIIFLAGSPLGSCAKQSIQTRGRSSSEEKEEVLPKIRFSWKTKFFFRCRVLFSYQPVHDDELELKVFQTECSSVFSYISHFKVDQNLDFMCEVEDGWWKGRLGGRVSACCASCVSLTIISPVCRSLFLLLFLTLRLRLESSPPTLWRCAKMTHQTQSKPGQKL